MVIGLLESQPWATRCQFAVRRDRSWATLQRGGMLAGVLELGDGMVEVVYEHALHEITRVRVSPVPAARLLLAIMQRKRLVRVVVPDSELSSGPDNDETL